MTTEQQVKVTLKLARKWISEQRPQDVGEYLSSGVLLMHDLVQLVESLTDKGTQTDVRKVVARAVNLGGQGMCILDAPCVFCGYNGANYWQKHTHAAGCPFYEVGGDASRADHIAAIDAAMGAAPITNPVQQVPQPSGHGGDDVRDTSGLASGELSQPAVAGPPESALKEAQTNPAATSMGAAPITREVGSQSPKVTPYGICSHCGADINPPDPTPRML